MDAPKKIWVDEVYVSGKSFLLAFQEEQFGCKEYIRADLVDELVKAVNAANDLFTVQKTLNAHMQTVAAALKGEK
jgi:hypothetical protein